MARKPKITNDRPTFELVEYNGQEARKYPDGAIRNSKGQMLAPMPGSTQISADTARSLVQRREDIKHAAIIAAANVVAQADAKHSQHPAIQALANDPMAWLQAVAMGRTKAAMDSDSPYGNAAANWLMDHTGNGAKQAQPQDAAQVQHTITIDDATRVLLERIAEAQRGQVVDGDVVV